MLQRAQGARIALTITDSAYQDGWVHWKNMVTMYNSSDWFFMATTGSTCAALEKLWPGKVLCLRYKEGKAYHGKVHGVPLGKYLGPLLTLYLNKSIVFSEMDVFWYKSPWEALTAPPNDGYDIQVSIHGMAPLGEVNIGFYFSSPSFESMQFYEDGLRFIAANAETLGAHTMDQKLFDHMLRHSRLRDGDSEPQWADQFALASEANFFRRTPLAWRRIPIELVNHNSGSSYTHHENEVAVHITYGINPASRRLFCAWRLGVLYDDSYTAPSNYLEESLSEGGFCSMNRSI